MGLLSKEVGVIDIISILLGIAVGIIAGYFVRKNIYESKIGQANSEADRIIKQAEDDSKRIHKEKLLEAQEEIHKLRTESERENKERRSDLQKFERRVIQKEEILDKKLQNLEQKETSLGDKLKNVAKKEEEIEAIKTQQLEKLESISGITSDKAKEIILTNAERDVRREMSIMIKEIESQAKEEAEKKSREIIGYAIQKCAADHVAETTVTVVNLPNDEMKGRIIGREGRNIRTLETLTGIDLIIDDTPEAVILSGFDPIRREVARIALEKLIADGRIHPARIEEMVDKARKEVENIIKEYGEQAAFETGVHGLHPELVKLLGRLNYRTSYGQNVLKHSIEVAHIAGIMAAEIGADIRVAKRAGLLHDIGKAVDHEMEGNHVEMAVVLDNYRKVKEKYDYITVEGSGGILCPICFDEARIGLTDIIDEMELDCILVADAGLGTINSVVLTYEYMKNRNMNIKGMIFNHYIADNIMHEDNIRMCEYMTGLPTLAKVSMGDVDLNIDIAELISLYR